MFSGKKQNVVDMYTFLEGLILISIIFFIISYISTGVFKNGVFVVFISTLHCYSLD